MGKSRTKGAITLELDSEDYSTNIFGLDTETFCYPIVNNLKSKYVK